MNDDFIKFLSKSKYLENVSSLNLKGDIKLNEKSFKSLYKSKYLKNIRTLDF